jgi:DNA mismatch repair protein MSH4
MREIAFILENLTDQSLVIIDELGRGTSVSDGLGITFAICEKLRETKAHVFIVTHYHDLAKLLAIYPNVSELKLDVEVNTDLILTLLTVVQETGRKVHKYRV